MNIEEFKKIMIFYGEKIDIKFTEEQLNQFYKYMNLLLEWNEKINLTAITDRDEFIVKHYVDSLIAKDIEAMKYAETVIDVGTGGGFPGIPLAILFPEVKDDLCAKAGITNVVTLHGRAEDLARMKEHRDKYDICVSRAVANMSVLSEYCLPFVRKGGYFLAYKGPNSEEEVKAAMKAIDILGGRVESYTEAFSADVFDFSHYIICIKKIKETPAKYPRKAGIPSKDPIK